MKLAQVSLLAIAVGVLAVSNVGCSSGSKCDKTSCKGCCDSNNGANGKENDYSFLPGFGWSGFAFWRFAYL